MKKNKNRKAKKNKKPIAIIGIIAMIALVIAIAESISTISIDKRKLVVGSYYENYAWGFAFDSIAVFDDGSIYYWNDTKSKKGEVSFEDTKKCNLETYNGFKKCALKYGILFDKKVSEKDIKALKERIELINDKNINLQKAKYGMNDAGVSSIFAYKNNKAYLIDTRGDNYTYSDNADVKKIIEIYSRYASLVYH